jgi:hypothetical protein
MGWQGGVWTGDISVSHWTLYLICSQSPTLLSCVPVPLVEASVRNCSKRRETWRSVKTGKTSRRITFPVSWNPAQTTVGAHTDQILSLLLITMPKIPSTKPVVSQLWVLRILSLQRKYFTASMKVPSFFPFGKKIQQVCMDALVI